MTRSRTYYVRMRAMLPPDEPMAPLMARLFVIWQDLLFEEEGIRADTGFDAMDRRTHHQAARTLYFLRANSRTLSNAKSLFDAFGALPTFRAWLAERSDLKDTYTAAIKTFNRHRAHIDRVRNQIGGHVGKEVGDALQYFAHDDETTFELHRDDVMRPHLATDLLYATLAKESNPEKRLSAYRRTIQPLALATGAMIKAMSTVAGLYVERMQLLDA